MDKNTACGQKISAHVQVPQKAYKEGEDGWLCVGRTNLEIKFGDIKQSFAAGLKALVLGADPVMLQCFSYHLQQHLRTQKTHTHHLKSEAIVKTLNVVVRSPQRPNANLLQRD